MQHDGARDSHSYMESEVRPETFLVYFYSPDRALSYSICYARRATCASENTLSQKMSSKFGHNRFRLETNQLLKKWDLCSAQKMSESGPS